MRSWALGALLGVGLWSAACGEAEQSNKPGATTGGSASSGAAGTSSGGASAAGAGGANTGGSVAAVPIPIADLCPVFTRDLCLYLMECNGARYRDAAHCESELDCFGLPQLLAAEASGAIDYDPSKVGECHERFIGSPCTFGFFLFTPDIYDVLAFCPGTVTPKQVSGAACSSDGECADGLYCYKGLDYQCPGACQARASEGQSCAGSARCAEGLTCNDELCEPVQQVGSPCEFSCSYSVVCPEGEVCPGNLWCDEGLGQCQGGRLEGEDCGLELSGTTMSTASCALPLWCDAPDGVGTCRTRSALGGPCNMESRACEEGLHCAGFTGTTLGQCVGPAAAGGECAREDDCQDGLVCLVAECAAPAQRDQACEESEDCASGLVCREGLCSTARYPGDACNDTDQPCTFSRCVAGICQSRSKVGAACALGDECASDACVAGACYDSSVCAAPAL